jgi:hypothetical protein
MHGAYFAAYRKPEIKRIVFEIAACTYSAAFDSIARKGGKLNIEFLSRGIFIDWVE